jgi:hypothetical protein
MLEIDVAISFILAGVPVTIRLRCFEATEGAAFTRARPASVMASVETEP